MSAASWTVAPGFMARRGGRLALALLAVGAAVMVLTATRWGIGASPDSVVYLGSAKNLLAGRGLSVPFGSEIDGPLVQFPPLYPALLAGLGLVAGEPVAGARILAVVLMAANMWLAVAFAQRIMPHTALVPLVTAGVVVIAPQTLALHAMAWSEPLFLALGFGGLLALARFLERGQVAALLISGALLGLACLTRYAGLALVGAGALVVLLWAPGSLGRRFGLAAGLSALGCLPLASWMLRNQALAGTATNRTLMVHPLQAAHLRQALDSMAGWLLLPVTLPGLVKLAAVLVAVGGLAALLLQARRATQGAVVLGASLMPARVLVVFGIVYYAFLVASISLVDANTPLDDRILAPIHLVGLILAAALVAGWLRDRRGPMWVRLGLISLLTVFVLGSAGRTLGFVAASYRHGLGFNQAAWYSSPLLQQAAALPASLPVYSNAPEAVYLHTGRGALRLPRPFSAADQTENATYADEIAGMTTTMQAGGVLVYFTALRGVNADDLELIETLGLQAMVTTSDGLIYGLSQ